MKILKPCSSALALLLIAALVGCSERAAKSPEVSDSIRKSLDSANLKDVSVSQDREKGVITLAGHVAADGDKAQAESIAKAMAGGQVVANQIAVIPTASASDAKKVNADLDQGIDKNVDAALIQAGIRKGVKYEVKSGVVTLTGEVGSEALRTQVQTVAATVPNVQQVVNELQVKNQKATSTN
jgi:hyperosmotically inducible periplasmic protein